MLSACATAPADRGMGDVQAMLEQRGVAAVADPDVAPLLAAPLSPSRAVAVALLRNPELRAEYARLGLAQADVIEAGRLSNPELSLSALASDDAGQRLRFDYGLVQNFIDVLLLRARSDIARAGLAQEKSRVAERIRTLALATQGAAVEAIGAAQMAAMRDVVARLAQAAADLAQRLHAAGNVNELELTRERAAATEAALAADAARARSDAARWRLHRLMGLSVTERQWRLAEGLPPPLTDEPPLENLLALALERRLDLTAQRGEAAGAASAAALVRRWRWLPFLAVGVAGERESDGAHLAGPAISLELPLFHQGQHRLLRAESLAELAEAGVTALELDIAADVAARHARMIAAARRATRLVRELIPQRERIVARLQELQNWMLVGQFELIVARQQEYDAYQSWLESVRDYWLARAELEHAVGAPLPDGRGGTGAVVAPPALPDPGAAPGMDGHHGYRAPDAGAGPESGDEPAANAPDTVDDPHAHH
jgi:cobalt-zinc-cadmium efflux system outer membrane protein